MAEENGCTERTKRIAQKNHQKIRPGTPSRENNHQKEPPIILRRLQILQNSLFTYL